MNYKEHNLKSNQRLDAYSKKIDEATQKFFENVQYTVLQLQKIVTKALPRGSTVSLAELSKKLLPEEMLNIYESSFVQSTERLQPVTRKRALLEAVSIYLNQYMSDLYLIGKDAYEEEYQETLNFLGYALAYQASAVAKWYNQQRLNVEKHIQDSWIGTLNDWMSFHNDSLSQQLSQSTLRAFTNENLANSSTEELRKLSGKTGRSFKNYLATSNTYLQSAMFQEMYKVFGVEKYKYVAILDTRTTEICTDLNNEIFETRSAVIGVNMPPMHWHCRSWTEPLDGETLMEWENFEKDVDEKIISLDNISFNAWLRNGGMERFAINVYNKSVEKYYRGAGPDLQEKAQTAVFNKKKKVELTDELIKRFGYTSLKDFEKAYLVKINELAERASIGVRFNKQILSSLLEKERYYPNPSRRQALEKMMYGFEPKTPLEAYPVYGLMLMPEEVLGLRFDPNTHGYRYGKDLIVLKDSIKERVTFTLGDSLNTFGVTLPTKIFQPGIESIGAIYPKEIVKNAESFFDISAQTLTTDRYAEVQIRGGFTLKDIAFIRFDKKPTEAEIRLLDKYQIPYTVYFKEE